MKVEKRKGAHCKSDGDKIQTCLTKLVCNLVKIYLFICYLTIQLVKLGGFSSCWLTIERVSSSGGMSLIFFVDYSVRKKYNLFNFNKEVCYHGHDFRIYQINFQNQFQPLQFPAVRMCISIPSMSNTPVEMRSGNVQLYKTYC